MSAEFHDLLKLLAEQQASASHYAERSVSDDDASNRAIFACLAANAFSSVRALKGKLQALKVAR